MSEKINVIDNNTLEFVKITTVVKTRSELENELDCLESELLTYEDHVIGIKKQIAKVKSQVQLLSRN